MHVQIQKRASFRQFSISSDKTNRTFKNGTRYYEHLYVLCEWRTNRTQAAPMIISHTSLKTNNDITLILGVH